MNDNLEAIESVIGALLREGAATLATAESCTGGLIAHRVTNVTGSSEYFLGGVVAYSNEVKQALLDVSEELLIAHGAVSAPVAEAMAQGARRRFGATYGVGVTGIAGPGGGTAEKPVGLVYIAVTGPSGARCESAVFSGAREEIKAQSAERALRLLKELLA